MNMVEVKGNVHWKLVEGSGILTDVSIFQRLIFIFLNVYVYQNMVEFEKDN